MGTKKSAITIVWAAALVITAGCEENTGITQPNSPDGNSAITWEYLIGQDENRSYVEEMLLDEDGDVYLYGKINGLWRLSCMEQNGLLAWSLAPEMNVNEMCILPPPGGGRTRILLTAGGVGLDGKPDSENAGINLYALDGSTLVQQQFQNNEYDIWIDDIELISTTSSQNNLIFVGGARKEDVEYPYCGYCIIDDTLSISLAKDTIMTGRQNNYFCEIEWNQDGGDPCFYIISTHGSGDDYNDMIACLDDSFNLLWENDAAPAGMSDIYWSEIRYSDQSVYVAGHAGLENQENPWKTGIVASVSEDGSIVWSRSINLSNSYDGYYDCQIYQDSFYAVGIYSWMYSSATARPFGYALVSKFSLIDGEPQFHRSFGGKRYASIFFNVDIEEDIAVCAGYTDYYIYSYWSKGWIVRIDTGQLLTESKIPPVREMETLYTEDNSPLMPSDRRKD